MAKLTEIEGIGPVYAEKLTAVGVRSCEQLLAKGATRAGREELVEKSGIEMARILKWVNHADLCRIKGVAGQYAELLEAAGVDSVPELAQRSAANLTVKMREVNREKKLVRAVPAEKAVTTWVAQAKELPRVVMH
ncbi:MAG: DUF4332 domain-containing protein [Pseudomonadales bacterium]|nr:DUF4332 domain-containing protein [Pseudomonadales bacterium]MCP5184394.1 DUF4332 domain-containing protein [Pseudomonadales bacterium]